MPPPKTAGPRNLTALEPLELALLPPEGLRFEEALPARWLSEALEPPPGAAPETALIPNGPGQIELVVLPLGPLEQRPPIQLRGALSADLTTACVRCLEDVSVRLGVDVDITLLPASSKPAEETAEAVAESTYEGRRVDLPTLIREALLLEVEPNPVCDDVAACDDRTKRLLEAVNRPAAEAAEAPDPRWAQLSSLLTGEEG